MNIYDEFIFSMYPHNFQDKHWSKFLFFFNPSSSTCLFNRWMYWFYWSSPFNATYKKGATAIHVFFPPRNICKLSVSVSKIKAMGITSTFVFNFTEMLNVIWLLWTLTTSSFLKRRNMALKCCYLNFSPVPCFFFLQLHDWYSGIEGTKKRKRETEKKRFFCCFQQWLISVSILSNN